MKCSNSYGFGKFKYEEQFEGYSAEDVMKIKEKDRKEKSLFALTCTGIGILAYGTVKLIVHYVSGDSIVDSISSIIDD